jgi:hypothetical protein
VQIDALRQLVDAHIREKRELESKAVDRRAEATARRAEADAAVANLNNLRRQADLERALAGERLNRDREQITSIRREVVQREAEATNRERTFRAETDSLRQQADARETQSREETAAFRRREVEERAYIDLAKQVVGELQERSRTESAVANERENRDREEITSLRRQVAERQAFEGEKDRAYNAETERLRNQATLVAAVASEESAANRRRAAELGVQIDNARRELSELQAVAEAENQLNSERERAHTTEITRIRREVAEREASNASEEALFRDETNRLKRETSLLEAQAREESAIHSRRAQEINLQIAQIRSSVEQRVSAAREAENAARNEEQAAKKTSNALREHQRELDRLSKRFDSAGAATGPFTRALERVGISTGGTRSGLRGLNAELQGFQLAVVIKYAQALISALISLAAQFVAVAAAAGQAAIGIGAALAAGAAQAVPVIGVLAAAFSRLTSILKIVKLQNQQQLTASHDAARAARAQTTATDQIRSAEQRVAEAHRNTARAVTDLARTRSDAAREELQAQQAVTKARQDAIRTVQDLMAAEEDAAQSLLQAQQSRQRAIETGDVMGAVQGNIDVTRAQRDVGRAREDAAPVRARGVEGVDAVQQAEQRLADTRRQGARTIGQAEQRLGDARRSEVQATQDLTRTRKQAADNLDQETASADKLADSLRQLSPAERQLYRRILALQDTYRRIARPITDIITRAFTGVVDRVNQLLRDPRIIRGFRNIATQIAGAIRVATREAGGRRSVSAFQILSAEAARNIPIATRILVNFFRAARNLVLDALPAFRLLLRYVEGYSRQAEHASRNSRGIRDFFTTGVRYAKAFFDLGLAVVRLLLSIAGRGGAAGEGIRTIHDLTGVIDGLTDKANHNAGAIRRFFRNTHDVLFEVLGVVGNLAKMLINTFSPRSVSTFAEFLNRVIIPALGTTLTVMGSLVTAFHQVFSLPGVAQVARVAATAMLLAQGFTIIQHAISSVLSIVPNFLRAMGLMATAEEVAAGAAVFTPLGIAVGIIAAVAAAVYLLDKRLHFLGPTWRWIKNAAVDALGWIKKAAADVVSWFSDVWTQGLLYWIRYPFVWLARNVSFPILRWIINAAGDVIDWLKKHFGRGGDFAIIGDLITFPFRYARGVIRLVFEAIKTIIGGALDLIAGRFDRFSDRMGDFWATFIDLGRGAVSSLLGIVADLLGALGKIPKIGGPFRDAAHDVRAAQDSIDNLRDSTRKHRNEQKKANDAIKDAAPALVTLRRRYEVADDRVRKLRPGTDAYRKAVDISRVAHKNYNEKLRDTADRSKDAQGPTRRLKRNIQDIGDTSSDTADAIAGDLNSVLKEIGAKEINVHIRRARRRSNAQNLVDSDNPLLGSPFKATGGIANPYGGPHDDHILYSPSGRPVAALSGTEGIVNTPQMGVINSALSFTQQMTGMPWGSLPELWASGMRHYVTGGDLTSSTRRVSREQDRQRDSRTVVERKRDVVSNYVRQYQGGGGLHPAIRSLSNRLDRMFGLTTTSTTGGGHARGSYHYRGLAADISGPAPAMERASRYIRSSGVWHSLLEGIHNPGLSVKNGRMVPPGFWGARTWADHRDHIHLAASSAIAGMAAQIRTPRFTGLGNDVPSRIARRSAQLLTRAANRYLQRQMDVTGGGDIQAQGADANVVAAFRRAARATGANPRERLALFEAGIVESGLRNLHYGDRDSLGSLQERAGIFGRGHALNPYASALRFLRDAISKRPWRGSAGSLAQAVQRSAFPGRYDAVRGRAQRYLQRGGMLRSITAAPRRYSSLPVRAARYLQTGGMLQEPARGATMPRLPSAVPPRATSTSQTSKLITSATRYLQGGGYALATVARARPTPRLPRIPAAVQHGVAPIINTINDLFRGITHQLDTVARGLRRSSGLTGRLQRAFARITGDGGLLDQMRTQTEAITERATSALQRLQFSVWRRGPVRLAVTDAQVAQGELRGLQEQRGGIVDERRAIDRATTTAQRALAVARRRRDTRARDAARAALNNLRTRSDANTAALTQNAQDQVEAQERFQQALVTAVNDAADRRNAAIERFTRLATALGHNVDPNIALGQQIQNMRGQIASLRPILARARRTGNTTLANQVADQIADLNTQIAETVAQQFQNAIDAVNNEATRQGARLDRATRIAQLGGQTDFGAMGNILQQRGGVMETQRAGLLTLLGQAQSQGNITQVDALTDQIDELNTSLAENTQAIQDNTDAAFNFVTQRINDAATFSQGLFSGAQGFFQALSESTGINTIPQQVTALQGIATSLATQSQGLTGQLADLLGDNTVRGLTGTDLVNYVVSIASGPTYQAILDRLDPTQESSFQDLVSALLGNATATVQNTQALQGLTGSNAQSFSSTLWSTFRRAVFTGAGGLLPQYQAAIPTAAVGAHVTRSGMMIVHAGENVRPAGVTRDWQGDVGGDTYQLNVTTPTEVLNPTDVARQIAFYRRNQGRR